MSEVIAAGIELTGRGRLHDQCILREQGWCNGRALLYAGLNTGISPERASRFR